MTMRTRVAQALADDVLVVSRAPAVKHTYYVAPSIRVVEDYNTKKIEVRATLGIAPDSHTIIEYPLIVWMSGYWNRATTRAALAQVKKRFLSECSLLGYTKAFNKPIDVKLFWES